jgi:hypothetical protein
MFSPAILISCGENEAVDGYTVKNFLPFFFYLKMPDFLKQSSSENDRVIIKYRYLLVFRIFFFTVCRDSAAKKRE